MKPPVLLAAALAAACTVSVQRRDPLAEAVRAGTPRPPEAPADAPERIAIEAVLDDWHGAAAVADGERYFGLMAPGAIFLGTDATERWTLSEFQAYAEPHFRAGRGWTYRPVERHVHLAEAGGVAWADELLWNEKYGDCRGTAVLRRVRGEWRIAHYSLTFLVPNELTDRVMPILRGEGARTDREGG